MLVSRVSSHNISVKCALPREHFEANMVASKCETRHNEVHTQRTPPEQAKVEFENLKEEQQKEKKKLERKHQELEDREAPIHRPTMTSDYGCNCENRVSILFQPCLSDVSFATAFCSTIGSSRLRVR